MPRIKLTPMDVALGPCPKCGKKKWWFNGVPLSGFCWGTDKKPHDEVRLLVRGKLQPYK